MHGKIVWQTTKKGKKMFAKKEEDEGALLVDDYSVVWTMKSKAKLVADVVGGPCDKKKRRFVYFSLSHKGSVDVTVES